MRSLSSDVEPSPLAPGSVRPPAPGGWVHRTGRATAAYLRRAPGTHILLLVLVVTTLVLRGVDAPTATRILRHQSTNFVEMSRDAPRVLLLSAFLSDQGRLLVVAIEFTLILVPLERWLGTYRWLCVFVAGHVGATLATTIGIWLQARGGSAGRDILTPVDVGISYGLAAAAGVLVYWFRRPFAVGLTVFLLMYYGVGLLRQGTFTDWGHLCALAIGFAIGPVLRVDPGPAGSSGLPSRWSSSRLGRWCYGMAAPSDPLHHRLRRRAATMLAIVLLAVGGGIGGVLLAVGRSPVVVVPPAGELAHVTVLGRPFRCGNACATVVVHYDDSATEAVRGDALLDVSARTLLRPGDRLVVRVDPRSPTHVLLVEPPRRVRADGLLGSIAVAALLGGVALLVAARRMSGERVAVDAAAAATAWR